MTNRLSEEQIKVLAPRLAEMVLADKRMSLEEMATTLGLQRKNLNTLRQSKHYLDLFEKLKNQREKSVERTLKHSTLQIREKLSDFTHEAIDTLYKLMTSAKFDSIKLSAACEILDRDGRFAKVSRLMNVQQGQDGAPMLPEDAAAEIMEAMKTAKLTVQ